MEFRRPLHRVFISYGSICMLLMASVVGSAGVTKTITVAKKGGGDFTTVQAAVDSVPANNNQWIRIKVKAGIYKEKVQIPATKPFIILEGEGRQSTFIVWGDYEGGKNISLDETSTFAVSATDFVARSISFKNSFRPPTGGSVPAIAATVGGDRSSFYECGFYGVQDTLNDHLGRHFFSSCYIEGMVDFIFGFGQSLYQGCEIVVKPYTTAFQVLGSITANGRPTNDPTVFVFDGCRIGGTGNALLGRAWRSYSRVVFHNTTMSDVVLPQVWDAWGKPTNNIFYAEEGCTGPGSSTQRRVKWMKTVSPSKIKQFESMNLNRDNWIQKQHICLRIN